MEMIVVWVVTGGLIFLGGFAVGYITRELGFKLAIVREITKT
jgi:hypothetical protein